MKTVNTYLSRILAACGAALLLQSGLASAATLPGTGVQVIPVKTSIPEETFQTEVVMAGLKQLGYDVQPIKELSTPTMYLAIANGDATFMADAWFPLHEAFYDNSGGDAKLWRKSTFITGNIQGYLIDKKTADKYHITSLEQFKDEKIAKLFDTNGDGKADLTGCNPGWGCERVIDHEIKAYGLSDRVTQVQGDYSALIANTITRYREGKPIFYYTWAPYWVSAVLKPGKDVVFLQVPFSSLPKPLEHKSTKLPDGKDYGFLLNTQRIVANRKFVEANPAARVFFEHVRIPIADINAQNAAMEQGAKSPADIREQVHGWIKAHQQEWDGWINAAKEAAK